MSVVRIKQKLIEIRVVAKENQPLAVVVQASDCINVFGKTKALERFFFGISRLAELAQDPVRLIEGEVALILSKAKSGRFALQRLSSAAPFNLFSLPKGQGNR